MPPFAWVFLAVLAAVTGVRLWLAARQRRHLQAHRSKVPEAFRERIPPEEHARAVDYNGERVRLNMAGTLVDAGILLALTLGGGIAALGGFWQGTSWPHWLAGTGLVLTVLAVRELLRLPVSAWQTFGVEARYGFNRMTASMFLTDTLKGAAVKGVLIGVVVAAFLALMAGGGPFWWVYAWVFWMAYTLFLTWAYPKWVAPLFNRFRALEDGELRERIAGLLQRCGFALRGVFVMDASRRTAHGNAYFTGLGGAKRVVFFDTLLDTLAPQETEAVLAHELGHFRLGHVRNSVLVSGAFALGALALLAWLRTQPWFFHGLGVPGPSDAYALVLFALVGPVFAFPARPLMAAWSRRREYQADEFAMRYSDHRALASALVKLFKDNAASLAPDPVYSWVYHSHPPPRERIAYLEGSGRP